MNDAIDPSPRRLIYRLAWAGAVLMLLVTTSSAYLRLRAAGLGCADWPHCYGQVRSPADHIGPESIAAARVVHRFSASVAGALALFCAIVAFGRRSTFKAELRIAIALVVLTFMLAYLGRVTPQARVPAVALGNLLGGMGMSALFVYLAAAHASARIDIGAARHCAAVIFLLIFQLALGALTSASFSGLACTTFPDCAGYWWPPDISIAQFNPWRILSREDPTANMGLHMFHRYLGVVVALAVISLGTRVYLQGTRSWGMLLAGLALGQIALGVTMVLGALPVFLALAHNVAASLLLSALVMVLAKTGFPSSPPNSAQV